MQIFSRGILRGGMPRPRILSISSGKVPHCRTVA
nr:MAG TPA: hypothetical protein [Caudoviricetes sp.]